MIARRLAAQGVAARDATLQEAASSWAIQDSPPGSALLAFAARVEGLAPDALDRALLEDRTLVAIYHPRTSTAIVPASELGAFGTALEPIDPEDLPPVLANAVAGDPAAALDVATAAVAEALAGGPLSRDDLHEALRARLPEELLPWCDGCQSHHARRGLLVIAGLRGALCIAGKARRQVRFAAPADWLGAAPQRPAREDALRALGERYRRAFGPSTATHLADWAGITRAHADAVLAAAPADDAPAEPSPARGVRLLPPGDPLLQARDRERLVPDAALRTRVWTASGAPGIALADGALAGLWRARKQGRRLTVSVEPVGGAPAERVRAQLDAEAEAMAELRGCTAVEVSWTG